MKRWRLINYCKKLDTSSPILKRPLVWRGNLRVTTDGHLMTAHQSVGSTISTPTIQTDFSEQQLELITPIAHSTKEARRLLGAISDGRPLNWWSECLLASVHATAADWRRIILPVWKIRTPLPRGLAKNNKLGISGILQHGARKDLVAALFQVAPITTLKDFKSNLYLKLSKAFCVSDGS